MAAPKQVLKQMEEVDKIEAEMLKEASEETPAPTGAEPPAPSPSADTPPKPSEPEPFEQQYRVLQGKYNKEVPRLNDFIQTLQAENNFLKRENIELRNKLAETTKAPAPVDAPVTDPKLENFKERFPDVYMMMESMVKSKDETIRKLQEEVTQLASQTKAIGSKTFWDRLKDKVADYEVIDKEPEFLEWLQYTEKYSPYTRHQLLALAVQSQDVDAAAEFFTDFKKIKETPPVVPAAEPAKAEAAMAPPKAVHSTTPPSEPGKPKTFKQSEVTDFYNKKALGRLKHLSTEQLVAMDLEYTRAGLENRIVAG